MDWARILWIVGGIVVLGLVGYGIGHAISSGNGGVIGGIIGAIIGAIVGYIAGRWGEGADAAARRH
jgi:hypothetical protein